MSINGLETIVAGADAPLNLQAQEQKVAGQEAVAAGKVTAHNGPHDFMAGVAAAALSYASPTLSVFAGAVAAALSGTKSHFAHTSQSFKTTRQKRAEPIPMGSELEAKKQPLSSAPPPLDIVGRSRMTSASVQAVKGVKMAAANIAALKKERSLIQRLKQGLNRFDNLNRLSRAVAKGSQVAQQVVQKNANLKQKIKIKV